MMCKYCDGKIKNAAIEFIDDLCITVVENTIEIEYYNQYEGWQTTDVTIFYCPMCGRKL